MKFFRGQRVRIKPGVTVGDPRCNPLLGEIVRIVERMSKDKAPDTVHAWYWLDVRLGDSRVYAHERALEPVDDGRTKLNWNDAGIVWRPREMDLPQVIRPNRHGQKVAGSANGRALCATHDRKVADDSGSQSQGT